MSGTHGPGAKVVAGFFSFTEVTDPSGHRAYNEWHQLDHLPEQLPLPGIVFGQRWVATPRCQAVAVAGTGELSPAQYLTIYLIGAPIEKSMKDFFDLAVELHQKGRFFEQRRAVTAGPLVVADAHAAPRVLVSAASVPYRPNLGVFVIVGANAAAGAKKLTDIPGVAGTWVFRPGPESPEPPRGAGGRFEDEIVVCYLDADPVESGRSILSVVEPLGAARFAGAFETITPWEWEWFDGDATEGPT